MISGKSPDEENRARGGGRPGGVPVFVVVFGLVMATACGAMGVYNYYLGVRSREMFRREMRNNVVTLAAGTEIRLAPLLVFNDEAGLSKLMSETFSFRVVVEDAFIVSAEDGKIMYDAGGTREGEKFDAGMLRPGEEMYGVDVMPPRGVGLAVPKGEPLARLVVGYVLPDPVAYQHTKAIYDYSKAMFDELSDIIAGGQVAQARVFLSNMIMSNPETSAVQLFDRDGVVFMDLYQDRDGTVKTGAEGVRAGKAAQGMIGRVSEKNLLKLARATSPAGKPVYEIYMPLMSGGERVGTIRIEYVIEGFVNAIAAERRKKYYAFALFLVAAGSGAAFSSVWISRPVRRLAEAALRAGRGDLGQVAVRHTGREMRELAANFSEMVRMRAEAEELLKSNEERLRQLSRRVISAQEEERASLGRELHDDFGHKFLTLTLKVEAMRRKGLMSGPEADALDGLVQDTSRELMRIYRGLKPSVIEKLGLSEAVEELVREVRESAEIAVEAEDICRVGRADMDPRAALAVYRVAQESLSNVLKHSGASRVRVSLECLPGTVVLEVEDDGRGIGEGASRGGGMGIVGMGERVRAVGGALKFSAAEGGGTLVRLSVPAVPVEGGADANG